MTVRRLKEAPKMKVYDSPIVEHHISPMIEAFSKILCAKPRAYIATQGKKFFDFIECRKSCAVRFHLAGKENAPRQSGDSSGPIVKPSKKSVVEPPPDRWVRSPNLSNASGRHRQYLPLSNRTSRDRPDIAGVENLAPRDPYTRLCPHGRHWPGKTAETSMGRRLWNAAPQR